MSRYSHGGSGDYHQGDYRGRYNNHRNNYPYGKINEDDVPESQHSIFVRGLPSSLTYDEIKSFFEDNVGPCSFDFQKVNYERQSLFVAVRFESKEHANEAFKRYRENDILGCRCEVTWFRDIRRYISYQKNTGGTINRGNFGRSQMNRYHNNGRPEYRKRRYSDERRSRSQSYSDSDRSRSRSRRSSKSRSSKSRSRSRSEGERSTSRESTKRRSESKEERRRKKEKKVKKAKKERRSRRSESESSRSDGERSRSSTHSDREQSEEGRKRTRSGRHEDSPASSNNSPLRMTPPPAPPIIGPVIPSATSVSTPVTTTVAAVPLTPIAATSIEKPAPLSLEAGECSGDDDENWTKTRKARRKSRKGRDEEEEGEEDDERMRTIERQKEAKRRKKKKITITIANKSTVPVENTSFKMQLDTDEPPRKIVRGPMTPERKEETEGEMDIEKEEEEEEVMQLRKETHVVDPKEKGGWRTVGDDHSGPPSDLTPEGTLPPPPPPPTLIHPGALAKSNGGVNGAKMVPRSVSGSTPQPPPPKRPLTGFAPSSLPPPPGRPTPKGSALAARYPEMGKVVNEIKATQDALISSIKPNALRLSDLSAGESLVEKMEEREKLINDLDAAQKSKFSLKMKQITTSYKGDATTITTVIKSVVQKDPSLEDQIKPALLAVLEDLEKQIYKKVDDFLLIGL